jgi:hypothetical protein
MSKELLNQAAEAFDLMPPEPIFEHLEGCESTGNARYCYCECYGKQLFQAGYLVAHELMKREVH